MLGIYIHPKSGKPVKQPRQHGDPRYINNEAAMIRGIWGLITTDFGCITMSQMEEARLAISPAFALVRVLSAPHAL